MKPRGQGRLKDLNRWLVAESFVIVIGSVMMFALVEYGANEWFYHNEHYRPIDAIGMLVPMGIIMGLVSYFFGRRTSRYISGLANGIAKVAKGEFGSQLNVKQGGPLAEVYENFNTMSSELQKVQSLRDDFINGFSHEFRTPISSIHGFARMLLETDVSDQDRRNYLEIIASETARLAELSSHILLLTQLDSQTLVPHPQNFSLDEQIKQCAILLSNQWIRKNLELTVDLEPTTYRGNPDLLNQVWINLLSNAIQFTPEGGTLQIALISRPNEVVVSVADSGCGMNSDEIGRIFDKYYQGKSQGPVRGLGLGLTIAKRIVDLCRGHIEVESTPGKGSRFTVVLPVTLDSVL